MVRGIGCLCSGLPCQGCLHGKPLWKIEIVKPVHKRRVCSLPAMKGSTSLSWGNFSCDETQSHHLVLWVQTLGTHATKMTLAPTLLCVRNYPLSLIQALSLLPTSMKLWQANIVSGPSPALPSSFQCSQEKPAREEEQPDREEGVAEQCSGFKGSQC